METGQNNEWKLTRAIRKFNKINPVSHAGTLGAKTADLLIESAKKDLHELTHPELGGIDMALGALLLGVPVGAAYGVLKMPEWIHAGIEKLKKMGVSISKEVEDIAWLKSLEGYVTGKQWAHKNIWRIKEKRA